MIFRVWRRLTPKHWAYVVSHFVMIVVGFILCRNEQSTTWFAIGGSLVATGLAGLVVFVHVLLSENTNRRLDILTEYGIADVFDSRSVRIKNQYDERLQGAVKQIDVLGFGQSAFREDYHQDFAKWKQRAVVRILLIDPEFPTGSQCYASQRDAEENQESGKINGDVRKLFAILAHDRKVEGRFN